LTFDCVRFHIDVLFSNNEEKKPRSDIWGLF
jgi:hypothetical protein